MASIRCLAFTLLATWYFLSPAVAENIETRISAVVKPRGDISGAYFGKSLETAPGTLYIGAPKLSDAGGLFSCAYLFTALVNQTKICYEIDLGTATNNTAGTSVTRVQHGSEDYLMTCGSQYQITCPNLAIEERMIGECLAYSLGTNPTVTRLPSICPVGCPDGFSVVFLMDASGSVSKTNFNLALTWVTNVLERFRNDIDQGKMRVGYLVFESRTSQEVRPEAKSYNQLKTDIKKLRYTDGGTNTFEAIRVATNLLQTATRVTIAKAMIVVTDGGSSDREETVKQASLARSLGITIVSVGVGGYSLEELRLMATGDASSDERVMTVNNFANLNSILDDLSKVIEETASASLEGQSSNSTTELTSCQFGTSVHVSRNAIYIGAIGSYDRTGTVAGYSFSDFPNIKPTGYLNVSDLNRILEVDDATNLKDSYFGYSVTSGHFLREIPEYVVMSAPRYLSRGLVLIYQEALSLYQPLKPVDRKLWQLGGYYGHSVLALDLNKDGLDDLMVSEPLYSKTAGYDEGLVFVYMADNAKNNLSYWAEDGFTPVILEGDSLPGSRFGMTLASGGDIDKNGFNDLIVGAPSEDSEKRASGAIYIYFSSSSGVNNQRKQKIHSREVSRGSDVFRGFGTAIRGESDFDSNTYPDIAVSAPSSDRVALLRARKLIRVTTTVTVSPTSIDLLKCANGSDACLELEVCWFITGASRTFDMVFNLTLDSLIPDPSQRRYRFSSADLNFIEGVIKVGSSRDCQKQGLRLKIEAMGKLGGGGLETKSQAKLSVDFAPSHKQTPMSEVMDPGSTNIQTVEWSIRKGCSGVGDVCRHDLTFEATFSETPSSEAIILSGSRTLTMNGTISNKGPDYAFFANVNITSGNLTFISATGGCIEESTYTDSTIGRTVLRYNSGRRVFKDRMLAGETCRFSVVFNFDKLISTASEPKLRIEGVIFSNAGGEDVAFDNNAGNNVQTFEKNLQYKSMIVPDGVSSPSKMVVNRTAETNELVLTSLADESLGGMNTILTHTYSLHNRGPLGFSNGAIKFTWTERTNVAGLYLLYLVGATCQPESACTCHVEGKVNPLNIAPTPSSVGNYDRQYTINYTEASKNLKLPDSADCKNSICNSLTCSLNYLAEFSKVSFALSFKPWIPTFGKDFSSMIVLSSMELLLPNTSVGTVDTTRPLRTTLSGYDPDEPPPEPTSNELNIGAIIGAVIGGILLLIIVVLVMWKAGFFKSKYGKMTRDARQSIRQSGGPGEAADDIGEPGESNAGFDNGT